MRRFVGKTAVIIGGNSGIGLASAKSFAAEGARVIITGRDSNTLRSAAEAVGNSATAYRADISVVREIAALFSEIRKTVGGIDVLFVNAGVGLLLPIESVTEDDWHRVQDTNLKGVFFCLQAALPLMSKGSAVVLTGSIAALKGGSTGSLYAASKAGLSALGRSFAAELADKGIRVNVVSPGPIDTPLFSRIVGIPLSTVPELRQKMIDDVPMKRIGLPEEVAAAVLFLASDAAAFITGAELLVDGGAATL
ncbi:MAG: SDR family oxidoreductase [Steroidobacteraceae bacterium]